jgi:hypothetical protein
MWTLLPNRVRDRQRFNANPKPNDCAVIRDELQPRASIVHVCHRNVERQRKPISYIHFIPLLAVVASDNRSSPNILRLPTYAGHTFERPQPSIMNIAQHPLVTKYQRAWIARHHRMGLTCFHVWMGPRCECVGGGQRRSTLLLTQSDGVLRSSPPNTDTSYNLVWVGPAIAATASDRPGRSRPDNPGQDRCLEAQRKCPCPENIRARDTHASARTPPTAAGRRRGFSIQAGPDD